MLIEAELSARNRNYRLWISNMNLSAVVFNLKKQQASSIDFLRVEPAFSLKLLKHVEATLKFTAAEHAATSAQSGPRLDLGLAVTAAALGFQVFIALVLRGNLADAGLVVAFLRQTKRDLLDRLPKGPLATTLNVYWLYAFFLVSKRWQVDNCDDLLSTFAEQLTTPTTRSLLQLLEKQAIDPSRLASAVQTLESGKTTVTADLDYKVVDKRLRTFFEQSTQQPAESLGLSFEKIADIERNQHEIANIIKSLGRPSSRVDIEGDEEERLLTEADIELKYESAALADQFSQKLAKETTIESCLQTMWQAVRPDHKETT
jgi:hypothetical protein